MNKALTALVVFHAVALSGCATTAKSKSKDPAPPQILQPLIAKFSTACLVPEAQVSGLAEQSALGASIAAALIPKAVGATIDFVGGLLQKAGEDKKTVVQATTGPYLYEVPWNANSKKRDLKIFPAGRCLHLLSFRDASTSDWTSLIKGTPLEGTVDVTATQDALGLLDHVAPTFYLEFNVRVSNDNASFMLVPTFLRYARAFSGNARNSELLSALSFIRPGADKPFASSTVLLRNVGVGPGYHLALLLGSATEWMPLDKPSDAVVEARSAPAPSPEQPERLSGLDPINVRVALTETQDGIKLLKALGDLLVGAKEDVTKAVTNAVPSAEKTKAEEASRLDDRNAYVAAMAEVAIKEAELEGKQGVEKAKSESELTKAKLAANKAALKAGIVLPYPTLYSQLRF